MDAARVTVGGVDGVRAQVSGARGRVRRRLDDSIQGLGLRFNLPPGGPSAEAPAEQDSATRPEPAVPFAVPDVWLPRLDLQFERLELISDGSDLMPVTIGPIALTAGRAEGADAAPESFVATAQGRSGSPRTSRPRSRSMDPEGLLQISGETAVPGLTSTLEEWIELSALPEPRRLARCALRPGPRASDGDPDLSLRVGPVRLEDAGTERTGGWTSRSSVDGLRSGAGVTAVIESIRLEQPASGSSATEMGGGRPSACARWSTSDGDGVGRWRTRRAGSRSPGQRLPRDGSASARRR